MFHGRLRLRLRAGGAVLAATIAGLGVAAVSGCRTAVVELRPGASMIDGALLGWFEATPNEVRAAAVAVYDRLDLMVERADAGQLIGRRPAGARVVTTLQADGRLTRVAVLVQPGPDRTLSGAVLEHIAGALGPPGP